MCLVQFETTELFDKNVWCPATKGTKAAKDCEHQWRLYCMTFMLFLCEFVQNIQYEWINNIGMFWKKLISQPYTKEVSMIGVTPWVPHRVTPTLATPLLQGKVTKQWLISLMFCQLSKVSCSCGRRCSLKGQECFPFWIKFWKTKKTHLMLEWKTC